jgi:hypothetical protein
MLSFSCVIEPRCLSRGQLNAFSPPPPPSRASTCVPIWAQADVWPNSDHQIMQDRKGDTNAEVTAWSDRFRHPSAAAVENRRDRRDRTGPEFRFQLTQRLAQRKSAVGCDLDLRFR